jgi:acetyl esterase/lipase
MAGEALLDRARRLLSDVDEAVSVTQSVGGELTDRAARLWEPLEDMTDPLSNIEEMRAAYEGLHAQFSPPPEIGLRPVNARGVSSLLLFTQPEPPPTILYLHGGGYVLGSAFGYRPLTGALAAAADASVLTPDYRLAPEHPFPAALEDAVAAYRWMLDRGADPATLTVAGDSSGGGLAVSLMLTLRERGLPLPGGAVLFCPGVDVTGSLQEPDEDDAQAMDALATTRSVAALFLDGHPAEDPIVSPLTADLTGLPPLLIQAATGDDRLEDSHALADRARRHGVDARLELYPVDTHVFQFFWSFLPEATDALDRAGRFAREARVEERAAR